MNLKDYLRDRRERFGMKFTARHFAKKLGITEGHLSKIVRGKQLPSFHLLKKIVECSEGMVQLDDFKTE